MTSSFDPQSIREFSQSISQPLLDGASAARTQIDQATHVTLPKKYKTEQDHLNRLLGRVPQSISMLESMATSLHRAMNDSTALYGAVEQTSAAASRIGSDVA